MPGIHVLAALKQEDVDGRAQASGSDAVLRTALPGHDERANHFLIIRKSLKYSQDDGAGQTAISSAGALPARFGFFSFAGGNSEQAASPAVSATPGLPDTMAATMAPSINNAS
jgi:hypothetical protein